MSFKYGDVLWKGFSTMQGKPGYIIYSPRSKCRMPENTEEYFKAIGIMTTVGNRFKKVVINGTWRYCETQEELNAIPLTYKVAMLNETFEHLLKEI